MGEREERHKKGKRWENPGEREREGRGERKGSGREREEMEKKEREQDLFMCLFVECKTQASPDEFEARYASARHARVRRSRAHI